MKTKRSKKKKLIKVIHRGVELKVPSEMADEVRKSEVQYQAEDMRRNDTID